MICLELEQNNAYLPVAILHETVIKLHVLSLDMVIRHVAMCMDDGITIDVTRDDLLTYFNDRAQLLNDPLKTIVSTSSSEHTSLDLVWFPDPSCEGWVWEQNQLEPCDRVGGTTHQRCNVRVYTQQVSKSSLHSSTDNGSYY